MVEHFKRCILRSNNIITVMVIYPNGTHMSVALGDAIALLKRQRY